MRGNQRQHFRLTTFHGPWVILTSPATTAPLAHGSLRPVTLGWLPGPPGRLERARAALPFVLDGWLEVDGRPLARLHVPQPGVGSGAAWARMLSVLGETAVAVARYSQAMRTSVSPDRDELRLLTVNALRHIERLAAWVVIDLALPIDRQAVVAEADAYLAEVEGEDNGLTHATDAIAALLEVRLGSGVHEVVSEHELERRAVEILAPLVAQAACLGWSDDGA